MIFNKYLFSHKPFVFSVADGEPANATNFNASFVSREVDSSTVGKLDLSNADAASGTNITNAQRELNGQDSYINDTPQVNSTENRKPTWNSDSIGSANQGVKDRLDSVQTVVESNQSSISNKIDKVSPSTDHSVPRHNGVAGILQDSGVTISDTDDVVIPGDLTVNGTTTTVNTSTLDIEDANITVNSGGDQSTANTNAAGLTVEMSDATDAIIGYSSSLTSKFAAGETGSAVEIATISHQQVITNKDIDGGTASDTSRITVPKNSTTSLNGLTDKEGTIAYDTTLNSLVVNDGSQWNEIAGGSASGTGKNYFANPGFDSGINKASKYNDVSGYVDGTGNDPAGITISNNTGGASNVLAGTDSLQIVKSASDETDSGVTLQMTALDRIDQGKIMWGSIAYDFSDSNFTEGDIELRAYDITNAEIIPIIADSLVIKKSTDTIKFKIPTKSNTDTIRVSLHIVSDSSPASSWTAFVDEVQFGPDALVPGAIVTDPETVTVTGSWTTNTTYSAKRWRSGKYYFYDVLVSLSGAPDATTLNINLPSGDVIDTSAIPSSSTKSYGSGTILDSGTREYDVSVLGVSTTSVAPKWLSDHTGSNPVSNTNPFTFANGDEINLLFKVPLVGKSSGALLSTTETLFSTTEIEAADNGGEAITANTEDIPFTEVTDDQGVWDGLVFTAPKNGLYSVEGSVNLTASSTALIYGYVDGSTSRLMGQGTNTSVITFSNQIRLLKDEQFSVRTNSGFTLLTSSLNHFLSIKELPDFSTFSVFGEAELIESTASLSSYGITAGQWGDLTSILLTPGEWDISILIEFNNNGATTYTTPQIGISTDSGTGFTDAVRGDNQVRGGAIGTANESVLLSIPKYNVTVASASTYYLKAFAGTSTTNLNVAYKISARRII